MKSMVEYTGSIENIYETNRGYVELGRFEKVVKPRFSPKFTCAKDLAWKLRYTVLFSKGI